MTARDAIDRSLTRRYDYRRRVEAAGLEGAELQLCAEDVAHWCDHWCFTYDPREDIPAVPFDLFPRQAELLRWLQERERNQENGLVEKSRDAGVTYLAAAYALHGWLFREGFSAGFGSRKLELVDRLGDPDSILEKVRVMLYALPDWMMPRGYGRRHHDNHAKLLNPANGSTITGEGGDNIGRGGRKSIYFVDEAAFLERPQSVDRALSQTTRVRIDVSTPNGPGNPFAVRRHSGNVPVFTLHWRDDPRKDDDWYAEQRRTLDAVTVAQEIDIDYSASIEGVCIPGAWVRAAVELDLPPSGPCVAGLDIAEEGPAQCVFQSRRGPLVDFPRSWGGLDTIQSAHRAADCAEELGATIVCYDADGIGANVRAAWRRSERPLRFVVRPVRGGAAASETRWPDGRKGRERFTNLRAELYWTLRTRFEKHTPT